MKNHFTPNKGWINDPNGTIYINGEYHLFYQHYPYDTVWGPMHWGHAVSNDMLTWIEKDIALCPDTLGYIFSGSCILDINNDSGFDSIDKPALIAIYTSHDIDTGEEQQSIAYSVDYEHFTKYEGNPVISNRVVFDNYEKDFRDPKIFKNTILGGFSIALAAGNKIVFYHSKDFVTWKKTGEFHPEKHGLFGICECPDLLTFEENNETYNVLTFSFIDKSGSEDKMTHTMPYFAGIFDGYEFKADVNNMHENLKLDYGPDNYAMVSFSGLDCCKMIGWGENWTYVNNTKADIYRGKMTIVRKAGLISISDRRVLSFEPCADSNIENITMDEGDIKRIETSGGYLELAIRDDYFIVDRSHCISRIDSDELKKEAYKIFKAKRLLSGTCDVSIIEDEDYFEIFADNGTLVFSVMTY